MQMRNIYNLQCALNLISTLLLTYFPNSVKKAVIIRIGIISTENRNAAWIK